MSAARDKGTAWETALVGYLRECGWVNAERRALHGSNDRGDIAGIIGVTIEAKSARAFTPGPWLDELAREVQNDRSDFGVVWVKRRGKGSPAAGFVLMDGATFTRLMNAALY